MASHATSSPRPDRVIDADRAQALLDTIRSHVEAARAAIIEAFQGRAWLALGYESWDAMCDTELGGVRLQLALEQRRELVGALRQAGMSTRAVGSALGISHETAAKDAGVRNLTPAPVTGLDGKTYAAQAPHRPPVRRPDLDHALSVLGRNTTVVLIAALRHLADTDPGAMAAMEAPSVGINFQAHYHDLAVQLRDAAAAAATTLDATHTHLRSVT